MIRRLSALLLLLSVAGLVFASPREPLCPPCQPIGETDDGIMVFRSRRIPSDQPKSAWYAIGFPNRIDGTVSHIDVLYQIDCAAYKTDVLEMHIYDDNDRELPKDRHATTAARIRNTGQIHDIILKERCPTP